MSKSPQFTIKFSTADPDDMRLYEWIRADTAERTVNVSRVIKKLLYAWYQLRWRMGRFPDPVVTDEQFTPFVLAPTEHHNGNGHRPELPARAQAEEREDPQDELVKRMAGASFGDFG